MTYTLRGMTLGLSALLIGATFAQPTPPYDVIVSGNVAGCSPLNSTVTIETVQNTEPPVSMTVQLDANCNYSVNVLMDSPLGWFQVTAPCNGVVQTATGSYSINAFDTTSVVINLNCGGPITDCLGVNGGSALPGTSCTSAFGQIGTWSAACVCVTNTPNCQACFTVTQASNSPGGPGIPFAVQFTNCSSGGMEPISYDWTFDNGTGNVSSVIDTVVTFDPGTYIVCMTMSDANGCASTYCDSVMVDADGWINTGGVVYDCLQIANGPNMPGTPCSTVLGGAGIWNANCECIPNDPTPCEAGFWVIQAYNWVDTTGNPNGGGTEPIPFELWVWNLSSGGTGNYAFVWDFGDGTTSTEAFPTHTYGDSGPYMLCLTMTDAGGCTDTYCEEVVLDDDGFLGFAGDGGARSTLTINVLQELPTGIHEQESLETTGVWPNPVTDVFNLSLNSSRSGNLNLSILDMDGRVVRTERHGIMAGSNQMTLSLSGLEAGAYLLRIDNGQQARVQRFVKIR